MTELFARPTTPSTPMLDPLRHRQLVHVNARHTWLPATITVPGRTRITLRYADPAPGLTESVPRWLIRPAAGVGLQPVHRLPAGAYVLAFDGALLEVAACRQNRNRWWVIHYTDAEPSTVPPRAVVRVADPTPIVTVHGAPLGAPGSTAPACVRPCCPAATGSPETFQKGLAK